MNRIDVALVERMYIPPLQALAVHVDYKSSEIKQILKYNVPIWLRCINPLNSNRKLNFTATRRIGEIFIGTILTPIALYLLVLDQIAFRATLILDLAIEGCSLPIRLVRAIYQFAIKQFTSKPALPAAPLPEPEPELPKEPECGICYGSKSDDPPVDLPFVSRPGCDDACQRVFQTHKECFDKWKTDSGKNECPHCRTVNPEKVDAIANRLPKPLINYITPRYLRGLNFDPYLNITQLIEGLRQRKISFKRESVRFNLERFSIQFKNVRKPYQIYIRKSSINEQYRWPGQVTVGTVLFPPCNVLSGIEARFIKV